MQRKVRGNSIVFYFRLSKLIYKEQQAWVWGTI